jgi:thiol-disulfide isomerase/thioredoxin
LLIKFLVQRRLAWATLMLATCVAQPAGAQGYHFQSWPASQTVPDVVLKDLSGQIWNLKSLKGRAVLINFWASWCEPCLAEMPSLQAVAQRYGPDKLVVLAVNYRQSRASIDNFVHKSALQLAVVPDPQAAIAQQWGVKVFPTTVLVTSGGRVLGKVAGEVDWNDREADTLLKSLF